MVARLQLEFTAASGSTSVQCLRQDAPWKMVRGFATEDGASLVHLNNVSGGVFGGDCLSLSATLLPGAQAQLTTTGATRAYRPRAESTEAQLTSTFAVGEGALLEYLPDTLIPFAGARVLQQTCCTMQTGSTVFWWDTIAPGRVAAGELFRYARLRIESEITVGGRPILSDRLRFQPGQRGLDSAACLGGYSYLVTFVAAHAGASAHMLRDLENGLADLFAERSQAGAAGEYWGVSSLPAHGVMVRGVTQSSLGVPDALHSMWAFAKKMLCNQEAIAPRKTY